MMGPLHRLQSGGTLFLIVQEMLIFGPNRITNLNLEVNLFITPVVKKPELNFQQ